MGRIRTIKPEFWTSESIARMPKSARLTFIALWSYVDDNGVGRDNERLILGQLFPLEPDMLQASRDLREDLARLSRESRVTRYTVDAKRFLHITGWSEHQKIDRPTKSRYPLPTDPRATPLTCDDAESSMHPREDVARMSRVLDASHLPEQGAGSREQGAGTREQGVSPSASDAVAAAPDGPQALVGEWIDHCGPDAKPPKAVIGQIAKQIKALLSEGIPYNDVRDGLIEWHGKRLHPSTLPSVVHEVRIGPAKSTPRLSRSTTDERVAQTMGLLPRMAELDAADEAAARLRSLT